MKIMSARLGEVEINTADIITLPDGIIGFPDFKRYAALEFLDDSPLRLLQAIDAPELAFFIIDPALFAPEFNVNISSLEKEALNAANSDDLVIRVIVTIPENPYDMTANLQGPLVINKATGLSRQIVNDNQRYTTKHRVLVENPSPTQVGN